MLLGGVDLADGMKLFFALILVIVGIEALKLAPQLVPHFRIVRLLCQPNRLFHRSRRELLVSSPVGLPALCSATCKC